MSLSTIAQRVCDGCPGIRKDWTKSSSHVGYTPSSSAISNRVNARFIQLRPIRDFGAQVTKVRKVQLHCTKQASVVAD